MKSDNKNTIHAPLNVITTKNAFNNSSFLSRRRKTAREESKSFFLILRQIFWGVTQYFHVTEHEFGFGY